MTHDQFERMRHAAAAMLALDRQGTPVDQLTLDWARHIAASAYVGPPARAAFQQQRIVDAMHDHPPEGMTAAQIRAACGMPRQLCSVTLWYMVKHRQHIAMLRIPGRSRYFATDTALEQGRALVEAEELRRAEAKVRQKRGRPPRQPADELSKPVPRPRTTPAKQLRPRRVKGPAAPHEQGVYLEAMLPAGVHIQHLAHGADLRFVPQPPIDGIGAVDEWARLTRSNRINSASSRARK